MAENSAEYRTMIDLTSELRLAVRSELISLSGSLLASRLISPEGDAELRNTAHSEVEQSAKLVELVQNKVRQNPCHYHSFIGILQGNQDQYRDILQQLEHTFQEHQHELDDTTSDCTCCTYVKSRTNELQRQFRLLLESILTELEERSVSVSKLLRSLNLLPVEIRLEYKAAITKMFSVLPREATVSDLFFHLGPLVDFLSYGLLRYIIEEFGSGSLKKKMNSYSDDITDFMKKTTVKQLMDVWPGQQEIPPSFSILRAKIDEDPSIYTLYQLDQLRKRFCCELKLTDIVFILIGLDNANSFIAEWLIHSTLIPQLVESAKTLEFGFFLQERILKMLADEKQLFPMLPDAKPKAPALQAAAATVTDLPEDPDTEPTSEQAITQLHVHASSSAKQPKSSPTQPHEIKTIRDELRFCALYSGVGVIYDYRTPSNDDPWKPVEPHLSSLGYKIINDFHLYLQHTTHFTTIAQSIQPPTDAELSDSHPFVIAVFLSGTANHSGNILYTKYGPINFVDDLIQPFLPQSAPHLQHIPKLFFITARYLGDLCAPPPHFPDHPDGNYCIAFHGTSSRSYMDKWIHHITDHLFLPGMTVQEVIKNSLFHLDNDSECLHLFTSMKNKLVLNKQMLI